MKLHELKPLGVARFLVNMDGTNIVFIAEIGSTEENFLQEAKFKGEPLTGTYSTQHHSAHIKNGQDHLHGYCKQNHLFAINRDGSAHDRSHQTQIPNKVADAIRTRFPNFQLPQNNLIENAQQDILLKLSQLLFD
jgi:hypothetical protein